MNAELAFRMKTSIRRVPDFPKKGIVFRDITTLWKDPVLLRASVDEIYEHFRDGRSTKSWGSRRGASSSAPSLRSGSEWGSYPRGRWESCRARRSGRSTS